MGFSYRGGRHQETSFYLEKRKEDEQLFGSIVQSISHLLPVGGWIRDLVLGINTGDVDIATNLLPEEILEIFPKLVEFYLLKNHF